MLQEKDTSIHGLIVGLYCGNFMNFQLMYSELINKLLVEASESVKSNFVRVEYFFILFSQCVYKLNF